MKQILKCFKRAWRKEPVAIFAAIVAVLSFANSIYQTKISSRESERHLSEIGFVAQLIGRNDILLVQNAGDTQSLSKVSIFSYYQDKGRTEIPPKRTSAFYVSVDPILNNEKIEKGAYKIHGITDLICKKEKINCDEVEFRKIEIIIKIEDREIPVTAKM